MQINSKITPEKKDLSPERLGKLAWRTFCTPQNSRRPFSNREEKIANLAEHFFIETEKIHSLHWIKNEKLKIGVYHWKPDSSSSKVRNQTVILVHGWNDNSLAFVALIKPLLQQGFDVIAFDAPGHGVSSKERTGIPEFSLALQALVKEIGSVYALIGHSLGAVACVYTTAGYIPLHGAENIEKLVLISSMDSLLESVQQFADSLNYSQPVIDGMSKEVKRLTGQPIEWYVTSNFVTKLDKSILIVHDAEDEEASIQGAERIASMSSNSNLIITTGLRHSLTLRSPKVVKNIVNFLC